MSIFLSLGSNLGDRIANLRSAVRHLALPVQRASSLYETEPVDYLDQPWFVNAVIQIEWNGTPLELLGLTQSVEQSMGRKRLVAKGPRNIDIDILFFNKEIIASPELTIPHPEIQNRKFVLLPLAEIAHGLVHPILQQTIGLLLVSCPDHSLIRKLDGEALL